MLYQISINQQFMINKSTKFILNVHYTLKKFIA
jgi:hypothetical protein